MAIIQRYPRELTAWMAIGSSSNAAVSPFSSRRSLPGPPTLSKPVRCIVSNRASTEVQRFNAEHAIGTKVRYWSGVRVGQGKTGVTTSEAFLLGGHTPVVMIDTSRSCVALTHVSVRPTETTGGVVPACPRCKRRTDVMGAGDRMYYCHSCQQQFDDCPDEGGDFDDRDPSRRLEREESRRARR